MKKLLLSLFAVIAVTSFAATKVEGFPSTMQEWNTQDVTVIDGWIAKNATEQLATRRMAVMFLKALVGKNAQNLTYEQFKTIAKQTVAEFKQLMERINKEKGNDKNSKNIIKTQAVNF